MTPPSSSGFFPLRSIGGEAAERVEEVLRVGVDGIDGLADQTEEVLAHPRDAGELRPVGDLVERQPVAELARREGELLLEPEDVRAHVVHDVLVLGVLVLDDQQVVLTEHPRRHPAEDHAHLGGSDAAGHRGEGVRGEVLLEAVRDGSQQALERRDVGADPSLAIGDARPSEPRRAAQAGGLGDLLLGTSSQFLEVGGQRGVVVRLGERFPARCSDRDLLGQRPVDRRWHCGQPWPRGGYLGFTTLLR
jgi:hypothetical protein